MPLPTLHAARRARWRASPSPRGRGRRWSVDLEAQKRAAGIVGAHAPPVASTGPEPYRDPRAGAGELAVETKGLERNFGARRALAGLDLRVARGACLGLLGPNGAGKSTTIAILCALLPADRGTVRVLGLDPARDAEALRKRIGVVPQELALYDELSARENLEFFGRAYGLSGDRLAARVAAGLEDAGLADRARERVRGFSGGMKRRLNFVAALLHEPELVFLDEPTVGVDPQSRSRLFDMVGRLHARGTTLVYTTHQLGEVERLCERVVIVDHGRAVAEGTVDDLRREASRRSRRAATGLEEVFLAFTGRELRDAAEEP